MKNIRYQKLPENFFEIMRRRKLTFSEAFFSVYLRGKCCRYGNPFYLSNKEICNELNTTEKILRKQRQLLQIKGVIKYDSGSGNKNDYTQYTKYIMLDSIMAIDGVTKRLPHPAQKVTPSCPKGYPSIYTNNEQIKNKQKFFNDTRPKNWKKETLRTMKL